VAHPAIVRGAHPSKTAKGEAADVVAAQRWASPLRKKQEQEVAA